MLRRPPRSTLTVTLLPDTTLSDRARFHREHGIEAVRRAQREIVLTMIRGHMDKPGARIGGDEIAGQERARPSEKPATFVHRMAGDGSGKLGAPIPTRNGKIGITGAI